MKSKALNHDYFIRNAIYCWLHYFPEHKWADAYRELLKHDTFVAKNEVQGRRRPAKRARQTKASTKKTEEGSTPQPNEQTTS